MEEFPKENTEQGGENNLSPEMQELADMAGKMGETQEKSYEEAKRDGELPEGVRDENDYREYLEEKGAREAETKEQFKIIVEKIDSLDADSEKRIFTAVLGAGADIGLLAKFANSTDDFSSDVLLKFVNEEFSKFDGARHTKEMWLTKGGVETALKGEPIYAIGEADEYAIGSKGQKHNQFALYYADYQFEFGEECRPAMRQVDSVVRYVAKNIVEKFDENYTEDDEDFWLVSEFENRKLELLERIRYDYLVKCNRIYKKEGSFLLFKPSEFFSSYIYERTKKADRGGSYRTVVEDYYENKDGDNKYRQRLEAIGFNASLAVAASESCEEAYENLLNYEKNLKYGEEIISKYEI